VLDIYELENSSGVVICMGGQSPNNIALPLYRENVRIYGTSPEMIDNAENRYKFSRMCDKIGVDQPQWKELTSSAEASAFCASVGYPVLVRPSYVLSGAGMTVVNSEADLDTYLTLAGTVSRDHPVVISKFIEEAKEIEMDAVAHDGKLIMHVITEHVENAGVHSGDATLILPPQDLDPETVCKIEEATAKIVSALHVTGPCNIQFIAKNNEIKIIECNVRASRSFPFVSKVLGTDLIELATKAIMNEPYEAYPTPTIKPNTVAVKVPQFSFSRLAGADPILGVEMASTGEVACFGTNKYEAYLKALVATGFRLPEKNILISIGSFKEKQEFLPSVIKMHQMGYNLFATAGTADFLQEHSVPCKYLEALEDENETDAQKLEYSLNQHLSNNLIDLYINLPSKNQYRRPASYMSRGYRSRRMAVDMAIPLITNVKCAKLFVEAVSRHKSFEIGAVDCQTTHETLILPGLVNVAPVDLEPGQAIVGGFTCLANVPVARKFYCDYSLSTSNAASSESCLLMDSSNVGEASKSLKEWKGKLIARTENLATSLLLANLYDKSIHFTQVTLASDAELILLAKKKGALVTFDVDVEALFGPDGDYFLENLEDIDCFSVSKSHQSAIILLLTAVHDGKLTVEEISAKMSTNPRRIFDLPEQPETFVEVELDCADAGVSSSQLFGSVHRVVINGATVFLDGKVFGEPLGKAVAEKLKPLLSPVRRSVATPISMTDRSPRARLFSESQPVVRFEGEVDTKRKSILQTAAPTYLNELLPQASPFFKKHITSVKHFQRSDLHILFGVAQEMKTLVEKQGKISILAGKIMCSAFWEPSTRTSCSFETAMVRLGGGVVSINQITSSIAKGETLSDTGN
jgi:carbamoyl-phosphate synthase / aspartate carbamoyltransferase